MGIIWFSEAGFYDFLVFLTGSIIGLAGTRKWLPISLITTVAINRTLLYYFGASVAFGLQPTIALFAMLYCLRHGQGVITRGFVALYALDAFMCALFAMLLVSEFWFGTITAVIMYFQVLIMIAGAINDGLLAFSANGRAANHSHLRSTQKWGFSWGHTGGAFAIGKSHGSKTSKGH